MIERYYTPEGGEKADPPQIPYFYLHGVLEDRIGFDLVRGNRSTPDLPGWFEDDFEGEKVFVRQVKSALGFMTGWIVHPDDLAGRQEADKHFGGNK